MIILVQIPRSFYCSPSSTAGFISLFPKSYPGFCLVIPQTFCASTVTENDSQINFSKTSHLQSETSTLESMLHTSSQISPQVSHCLYAPTRGGNKGWPCQDLFFLHQVPFPTTPKKQHHAFALRALHLFLAYNDQYVPHV